METTVLTPAEELRRAGLRVTEQRALVLGILRQSGEHLDAEGIYAAARAQQADVSLATVYRAIRALERAGLIEQRHFGPGQTHDHYEASGGPEHYHFACVRCHRVFEFETPLLNRLQAELQRRRGWRVDRAHLTVEGECDECTARRSSEGSAR